MITLCEYYNQLPALDLSALKIALANFGENPPNDYALAAKEAVNNKKERTLRAGYVRDLIIAAGGQPLV